MQQLIPPLIYFLAFVAVVLAVQGSAGLVLTARDRRERVNRRLTMLDSGMSHDEVYAALKAGGASLCHSEREDNEPPPLVETAPWGYVRLRLETYSDQDLERWARRLDKTGWRQIYVYFMHEPTAPAYARTLMGFVG